MAQFPYKIKENICQRGTDTLEHDAVSYVFFNKAKLIAKLIRVDTLSENKYIGAHATLYKIRHFKVYHHSLILHQYVNKV